MAAFHGSELVPGSHCILAQWHLNATKSLLVLLVTPVPFLLCHVAMKKIYYGVFSSPKEADIHSLRVYIDSAGVFLFGIWTKCLTGTPKQKLSLISDTCAFPSMTNQNGYCEKGLPVTIAR